MTAWPLLLVTNRIDLGIMEQFVQWRRPVLDGFFYTITRLGDSAMVWILLGLALLLAGRLKAWHDLTQSGFGVLVALLGSYITTELVLKPLFNRPRPLTINPVWNHMDIHTLSSSFPSGHTGWGFAVIPILWALDRRAGIAATVFAVLMGVSRIYLSAHWASDVLAGAVLGYICGLLVLLGFRQIGLHRAYPHVG